MSGVKVASAGRVEELNTSNALSFEAAQFGFEGRSGNELDQRQTMPDSDRRRNPNLGRGRFNAPNDTFAKIVENQIRVEAVRGHGAHGGSRQFAGLVTKVISTYELNAQVIHGTLPRLGTSLSIRL